MNGVAPGTWRRTLGASVLGAVYVSPVLWMLLAAFKTRQDAMAVPPKLFFSPTLEHYAAVFNRVAAGGRQLFPVGFQVFVLNSLVICGVGVLVAVLLAVFAAYAFARLRVAGTHWWLLHILALRMMPPLVFIIPLYVLFARLGMGGSYAAIILVYVAYNLPFAIWMLVSFFRELPVAAEEAAWLDGSSRLGVLRRVCLPQLRAGVAATAVIAFVFTWNEFLYAQMLTGSDTRTIPIAMLTLLGADFGTDWGAFAAAGSLYLLPVLLVAFFLQGQLLRGASFGTVSR